MNIDDKHFEHLAKMKSLESMSKWYGWDSPIGLSIFFLTLVTIAILLKWAFFSHVGV
jgi:hypothetical protein